MKSSSSHANQRTRQRESTRQQILDAAISMFAREGFEAASMADIAATAGVKKALVQYHFETKDKLWKEAVTQLWARRDAALPQRFKSGSEAEGQASLREILTAIVETTRENPEWLAVMFRESHRPGPRLDWLIEHFLADDISRGCSFIEQAQQAGLLPQVPSLQLLHLVSGALSYNLLVAPMTRQATGVDLATRESIDEQVDILLTLLESARG